VADAAEPVGAGSLQSFQHGLNSVTQIQVGVSYDGGSGASRAVHSVGASGGDTLDEFNLAYGFHLFRAGGPVHRPGLNKHGRSHIVAAVHVVGQFV
jgi:hypothetical protein